jgi:hypothetical protein
VPGRVFNAKVSEPPKVFAVPGRNTTEGVTFRDDLAKVRYEFEYGVVSSARTGGDLEYSTPIAVDLCREGIA